MSYVYACDEDSFSGFSVSSQTYYGCFWKAPADIARDLPRPSAPMNLYSSSDSCESFGSVCDDDSDGWNSNSSEGVCW